MLQMEEQGKKILDGISEKKTGNLSEKELRAMTVQTFQEISKKGENTINRRKDRKPSSRI